MVTQVITFGADGSVSGLQVKKGRGVDLRSFGTASIVRATLIEWNEEVQGWEILIQDAPGFEAVKGFRVTPRAATKAGGIVQALLAKMTADGLLTGKLGWDEPIQFLDYEDAVRMEIAYLDAWRVAGRH